MPFRPSFRKDTPSILNSKTQRAKGLRRPSIEALESRIAPAAILTATKVDIFTDSDLDGKAEPGETITYQVVISNTGDATALNVTFEDLLDPNTTLIGTSINVSPLAINDTFTAVSNTQLRVGNPAALSGPASVVAGNVLSNDRDFLDDAGANFASSVSISAFQGTSTQGGTVALVTTGVDRGSFSYVSAVGFTGTDTFTYTLTDNGPDGIAGNADDLSGTGTVTITVQGADGTSTATAPTLWYVDNSYANANGPSDGRSHRPFTSLTPLNVTATDVDGTGDLIHVANGTGAAYTGGIALETGQILYGSGSGLSIASFNLTTAGTAPTLTNAGNTAITLGSGNTLRGFTAGSAATSISGTNFGTLDVLNVTINNTSGAALSLVTGAFASGSSFNNITSTGGVNGIALTGVTATGLVGLGGGALSGASGAEFFVSGGNAQLVYSGTITNTAGRSVDISTHATGNITLSGSLNDTGTGVSITNNTSGTIAFTGSSKVINTGANTAFTFTGNGASVQFTGGNLDIDTTTGGGIYASGNTGSISVTGTNNTINSGAGTALNVSNTLIGALGLTFQSISAGTATGTAGNGITLDTTGSNGGLTITGTGSAGSGGTIRQKTGADGSLTSGNGIYLNNTSSVSLNRMQLNDFENSAIRGFGVAGFSLKDSVISGTVGNNSGEIEGAIAFGNVLATGTAGLTGNSLIQNVNISGSVEHHVEVYNQTGTLHLTIVNSNIHDNSTSLGSDGIQMEFRGNAQVFTLIDGNQFSNNRSQAIQLSALESSNVHATISSNTITRGTQGNEGIVLTNGGNADLTALIGGPLAGDGNTISGFGGTAIFVGQVPGQGTASSLLQATIQRNTVTSPITATNHSIIAFLSSAPGQVSQARLLIDNNTVTQSSNSGTSRGILVDTPDPTATPEFHATVTNNLVTASDVNAPTAISVAARNNSIGHSDVRGNDVNFTGGSTAVGINVREAAGGNNVLARGSSASSTSTTVLAANNPLSTTDVLPGAGVVPVVENNTIFAPSTPNIPNLPLLFAPSSEDLDVPVSHDQAAAVTTPTVDQGTVIIDDGILSQAELDSLVDAAIARWATTGLTSEQVSLLHSIEFSVEDLPGWYIGSAQNNRVILDADGAGNAWFIDATPLEDGEFAGTGTKLGATLDGGAAGRIDALTTIMHELGHRLGLEDSYASSDRANLMFGYLGQSERRLPATGQAEDADPTAHDGENGPDFLFSPITIGDLPAGKGVTIVFKATVNDPPQSGSVSNQGTVKATGLSDVLTDDPTVTGTANPTVTLVDLPDVSINVSAATVTEDGSGNLVYTFTRTGANTSALAVAFSVTGAATLNSSDYTVSNGTGGTLSFNTGTGLGTVTFSAGSTTATVIISPNDDTTVEADESISMTVTGAGTTYDFGSPFSVLSSITNDDTDVSVAIGATTSVSEDGAGNLVYTFTRSGVTTNSLTANFSIAGTTSSINDYGVGLGGGITFSNATGLGTVTFAAGETTKTLTVDPAADNTAGEADETAIVTVLAPSVGNIYSAAGTPATGTITNDDSELKIELLAATSTLEDGAGNLVYTFTRTGFLGNALAVSYQASGTATGFGAGTIDYTVTPVTGGSSFNTTTGAGVLVFAPGAATATLTIDPTVDTTTEPNETVIITLNANTTPPAATGGYGVNGTLFTATGTINDDDASLRAILDGSGNLTIQDISASGQNNNLTFRIVGTGLEISDLVEVFDGVPTTTPASTLSNGGKTLTIPLSAVTGSLTINTAAGNDTVTLDLTGGDFINAAGVDFNGGQPAIAPGDKLVISGGAQGTVTYNYTNSSDGSVVMSLFGTVRYTGLEPVSNTGTATDVIFNLPGTSDIVFLEDNGATNTDGMLRLRSTTATFETTDFGIPTNSLTINLGAGNDTFSISSAPQFTAGLTINGDTGDDTINLNTAINFAAGNNLNVDLQNDDAVPGIDIITMSTSGQIALSGTGSATFKASKNIQIAGRLATENGDIILENNQQAIAATGNFQGVNVLGTAIVENTGTGHILVKARGGNDAAGQQNGFRTNTGALVRGGTDGDAVVILGYGGATAGNGIFIPNGAVRSLGGNILFTGFGAGTNTGVTIQNSGVVSPVGTGNVVITAQAAMPTGIVADFQLFTVATNPTGVFTSGGSITINADSMNIGTTNAFSFLNAGPTGTVTIRPRTAGQNIDIGSTASLAQAGVLDLSDAELDRIVAGTLVIGAANSGTVSITNVISPAAYKTLSIPKGFAFTTTSTTGGFESDVTDSTTYEKIVAAGPVTIDPLATLTVTAVGGFTPTAADIFTIINNTSASTTTGTFAGKPEGSNVTVGGFNELISYVGGPGSNDVQLLGTTVEVTVAPASALENSATGLVYTFTRTGILTDPLPISFTKGGVAVAADYTATSTATTFDFAAGTLTIPAGQASVTVTLVPVNDTRVETDETAILTVAPGAGYGAAGSPATGTITDNDVATISIAKLLDGAETNTPTNGSFRVTQSAISSVDTVVSYTIGGTATPGSDFTALSGTVTILAGQLTADIIVPVLNDVIVEATETVTATLTAITAGNTGVTLSGTAGALTSSLDVTDNDTATVSIALLSNGAETAAPTNGSFRVTQSAVSSTNTVVNYTIGGSATSGSDFTALSGTVTILAGQTTADIIVPVLNDAIVEATETVTATLTSFGARDPEITLSGTAGALTATVNVTDNDTATISIAKLLDGAETATPTNGAFRVTQSAVSSVDTVVSYTIGGTATSGSDFTALSGTVTILAGQTTADIIVPVLNDALVESTETVSATLTTISASNAGVSLSGTAGALTSSLNITDNDTATVSIALLINGAETNTPTNGSFRVTQSAVSSTDTVVNYTIGGTATSGSDFTALSGTVTILAGQTTADITVPVLNDVIVEATETVTATLSSLGAHDADITLSGVAGALTSSLNITDNDTATVSIARIADGAEANTPTNGSFRVTQSAVSSTDTVVNYTIGGSATSGSDFTALSGTVTILAGQTTADIIVPVLNDTIVESSETVIATLTSFGARDTDITLSGTAGALTATVNVTDNDTATISIAKLLDGAETATPTNGTFRVTQTAVSSVDTVVNYAIGGTATSGSDFTALSGTVTILAGQTTADIIVPVLNDVIVEATETVTATLTGFGARDTDITLSAVAGALTASLNVTDNDTATISIAKLTDGSETNTPTNGSFRVTQSVVSSVDTVVSYTIGGIATSGSDFTALSGTVTILAGQTTADIIVPVLNDGLVEATETVLATLTTITAGNVGVTLSGAAGALTSSLNITDSDTATWSLTGSSGVTEGANATYTLSLAGILQAGQTATTTVALTDGTTIAPDHGALTAAINAAIGARGDLAFNGTTLTYTGTGSAMAPLTFALAATDDTLVEANETFSVTASSPGSTTGATVNGSGSVSTTISDNDTATWSFIGSSSATEGANASYTIALAGVLQAGQTATTTATLTDGTSVAADHGAITAAINAAIGARSDLVFNGTTLTYTGNGSAMPALTFSIAATDDSLVEGDESYSVAISTPASTTGAAITGTGSVGTTITDNDTATWSVTGSSTVSEGANATYTIALAGVLQAGEVVSTNVTLTDGTTVPADHGALAAAITTAIGGRTDLTFSGGVLTYTGNGSVMPALTFTIGTTDDTLVEASESFAVAILAPASTTGATITGTGSVSTSITDNDTATWSLTGSSGVTEGANATYTLSLAGILQTGQTATTTVALTDGTTIAPDHGALTAAINAAIGARGDLAFNGTTLTYTGTGSAMAPLTFALAATDDTLVEANETFSVTASSPGSTTGATVNGSGSISTTISDNDTATWSLIGSSSATEGANASYTIALAGVLQAGQTATTTVTLTDGTSVAADHGAITAAINAAIGARSDLVFNGTTLTYTGNGSAMPALTFSIAATDDSLVEGDESYSVAISTPASTTGAAITGTGSVGTTITDNDTATWSVTGSSTISEGANATYTIALAGVLQAGEVVSTNVTLTDGTTVPADHGALAAAITTAIGGRTDLTFSGGVLTYTGNGSVMPALTFTIGTTDDTLVEASESFAVAISAPASTTGATITGTGSVSTSITDSDTATWSFTGGGNVTEGAAATYTLSLAGILQAGQTAVTSLTLSDNTALPGDHGAFEGLVAAISGRSEFSYDNGILTYTGTGSTLAPLTFTISTTDNNLVSPPKDFIVGIANPGSTTGAQVTGSGSVQTSIIDNDIDLAVTGAALVLNPVAGSGTNNATFTVTVTNNGFIDATNLVIGEVFVLPPGTSFSEAIAQTGSTFTLADGWSISTLAPGASTTLTVHFTAAASTGNNQVISTLFSVSDADQNIVNTPNDSATLNATVIRQSDLSLTKIESIDPVSPTHQLTYTITVFNSGPSDNTSANLRDILPAGFSNATWTTSVNGVPGNNGTGDVDILAAIPAQGTLVVTVTGTVTAPGNTTISNTATITSSEDSNIENNFDTESTFIGGIDLQLTKTGDVAILTPGEVIKYTLTYRNGGYVTATGVEINDIIPANTLFDLANSTAGWQDASGNPLTDAAAAGTAIQFPVGSVPVAEIGTSIVLAVRVPATVPAGVTTIDNTAIIADDGASGPDFALPNNTASTSATLDAAPDLQVSITDDPIVANRGGTTSYLVSYANVGNQDSTNVAIRMTLPANTSFNVVASTGIWTSIGGGVYELAVGNVAAGEPAGDAVFAVTLAPVIPAGYTFLTTQATIDDGGLNGLDPVPANNTDTETTPIYQGLYAVAPGISLPRRGAPPVVRVFDIASGIQIHTIEAYELTYKDSVRVALGDINGDGYDDIITSTRNGNGRVRVFDGVTGERFEGPFAELAAFPEAGARGAFVASDDVTGDGRDDIIVGSGQNARGAGKVRVFDGVTGALVSTTEPFNAKFRGGVRVATGDVNGDGIAEVIASQGYGGNDVVVYTQSEGSEAGPGLQESLRLEIGGSRYRGGVFVATGDLDGDGRADIVAGRDRGRTIVETFNGSTGAPMDTFVPFLPNYRLGARVAVADMNLDGIADIIVGAGGNGQSEVKVFNGVDNTVLNLFQAFSLYPKGSLFVAGSSSVPAVRNIQLPA